MLTTPLVIVCVELYSRAAAVSAIRSPELQSPTAYGPAQRFGRSPTRLAPVTTSRLPSCVTSTSTGDHAVGMKPITRRRATLITASAFSPASATYSRLPSGLTVIPSGIAPSRAPDASETSIVATTASLRVSITDTVFEFAVYTSSCRGLAAIADGWSACSGLVADDSGIWRIAVSVAVSTTETARPSHWVTYAFLPPRSNVTPNGCAAAPRSITDVTAFVAGSITVTVRPGGLLAPARAPRLFAT